MAERVTIQDIADALGVSRNTVSKAINNTGILADATREKVLKKAMEMGYKQFSYVTVTDTRKPSLSLSTPKERSEVALFTTSFVGNSHFSSTSIPRRFVFSWWELREWGVSNWSLPRPARWGALWDCLSFLSIHQPNHLTNHWQRRNCTWTTVPIFIFS